jgi:hypothetical protein
MSGNIENPQLRILGLGTASVYRDQTLLEAADWTYAKPRELLFLLLCENDLTKEQIGAALWPWTTAARLRNSFHTTLHHLRRALGRPDWIIYERAGTRSTDHCRTRSTWRPSWPGWRVLMRFPARPYVA